MRKKINSNELFFNWTNEFLYSYLAKTLSRSSHTVESYTDGLTIFRRYLWDEKGISMTRFKVTDLTVDFLLEYIEYLKKNHSNSTVNQRITAIKSYMKYIADQEIAYLSIYIKISNIPPLKVPQKIKPVLDDDMLSQIIESAGKDRKGLRNRVMMILLYDCAIRVSELVNIKKSDIFTKNGNKIIYIHGKGDKERLIVLSSRAAEHLNRYLDVYHSDNANEYLFYTIIKGKADHITVSSVQKIINKIVERLRKKGTDLPESVHPHMFRRSRATHLYQDGIPLEQISRLLGHSYIETTKIYANMSVEQMKEILEIDKDNHEEPEWDDKDEDEIIRMFGLRK